MTPLEAAKRLSAIDPWHSMGSDGYCIACDTPVDRPSSRHADDCPVLVLPRIVAALEAAEALIDEGAVVSYVADGPGNVYVCNACYEIGDSPESVKHTEDCRYQAVVAALRTP